MPRNAYGQLISFAIESDEDTRFARWIWLHVHVGDTVSKIAARRGHPEDARRIADQNHIRDIRRVLLHHPRKRHDIHKIRVPGELKASASFHVLAGDSPPRITNGYAKLDTLDRPERTGLTTFSGYDPFEMEVQVRFLGKGPQVEQDIELLEKMAGRGDFAGAGIGPPPVIRISTTGPKGEIVPLIPRPYQWTSKAHGPLWRVQNPLDWDEDPRRDKNGDRIEQKATITVQQATHVALATRSATHRNRARHRHRHGRK